MTNFEKLLKERIDNAKVVKEKDLKEIIVESLKRIFLNQVPTCIDTDTELVKLTAPAMWVTSGCEGDKSFYILAFEGKKQHLKSLKELMKFVEDIKELFPSDYIGCNINDYNNTTSGLRDSTVLSLEFFLDVREF